MFEEIIDDIQDSFSGGKKGNGLSFLIIGFIALFIIMLLKDNDSDKAGVVYTYASYPDAGQNANVIIDTLQDSIQYSEDELKDYMNINFVATNDYINEGFNKSQELANTIFDSSMQAMEDLNKDITDQILNVGSKVDNVNNSVNNLSNVVETGFSSVQSQISDVSSSLTESITKVQSTVTGNTNAINNIVKTQTNTSVSTTKTNTSASTTSNKTTSNTIKATSYTGNSIVDGLKSVGVNSSYSYRQQLAQANGIKNYTGSASQNTTLLNLLKQGKLVKA